MKTLLAILTLTTVAHAEDWNPFLGKKDTPINTPYSLQLSEVEEQIQQAKIKRQIESARPSAHSMFLAGIEEVERKEAEQKERDSHYRGVPTGLPSFIPSLSDIINPSPQQEILDAQKEANRLAEEQVQVLKGIRNDAYDRELYRNRRQRCDDD